MTETTSDKVLGAEIVAFAAPIAASAAQDGSRKFRSAPLLQGRMRTLEQVNNTWSVITPAGTPFEALLDEPYWANVARLLKIGDKVVVHTDDGMYYGELLVRAAFDRGAKVVPLGHFSFNPVPDVTGTEGYEIKFRGHAKWSVIRKADNEVLKWNFETPESARLWLDGHKRALGT